MEDVKPCVLIAGAREDNARVAGVLSGYVRRFAGTFDEASRALQGLDVSLIVVCARFRERQQLLRWLREAEHASIPVAQIERRAGARSAAPVPFIDLRAFPEDHRGDRRLRRLLDGLMERRRFDEGERPRPF